MRFILILLAICFQLEAQTTLFKDKCYVASGKDTVLTFNSTRNALQLLNRMTIYSEPFQLSKSGVGTTGNWGVIIQPDSAGYAAYSDTDADTMIFWPEYWLGSSIGWITGDTMRFHSRYDTILTGGFADTTTFLIDIAGNNVNYFWQSSPADSFSIHAFPVQRVRVKGKVIDATAAKTVHYGLKAEIVIDIR